jgi:poly(3-hydroxybutyrate) depolymerase
VRRALLLLCACGGAAAPLEKEAERCTDDDTHLRCKFNVGGVPSRTVQWQTPRGDAPAVGWPAVLLFHGSFQGTGPAWNAQRGDGFGAYRVAQTTKALLDRGYVVLTPESIHSGNWYWNTNQVGFADNWSSAPDAQMMTELFSALLDSKFGDVDMEHLYATGISSGGYMTSRMAVSYSGRFKALAVVSASYATCGGLICSVPELPADHPPTLLLHGEKDLVVPIGTMRSYEQKLKDQGLTVDTEVDAEAGHEWLSAGVTRIPDFFDAHR